MTAFFSVICSKYPDQKTKYIGYLESAVGLGLMAGPPIASLVYGRFGYALAFYFFSAMIAINQICMQIFLPASLNRRHFELED